jgi:hypothetical protein
MELTIFISETPEKFDQWLNQLASEHGFTLLVTQSGIFRRHQVKRDGEDVADIETSPVGDRLRLRAKRMHLQYAPSGCTRDDFLVTLNAALQRDYRAEPIESPLGWFEYHIWDDHSRLCFLDPKEEAKRQAVIAELRRGLPPLPEVTPTEPTASATTEGAPVMMQAQDATQCTWKKKGKYWEITYSGNSFDLRDTKGMNTIAILLQNPNKDFTSVELARAVENNGATGSPLSDGELLEEGLSISDADDGGEILDERTKQEYWEKINELREHKRIATESGEYEKAEKCDNEIDTIIEELKRRTGLVGKSRQFGGQSEKARTAVAHRVKDAIAKIKQEKNPIGAYLEATIETGRHCAYRPEKAQQQIPMTIK